MFRIYNNHSSVPGFWLGLIADNWSSLTGLGDAVLPMSKLAHPRRYIGTLHVDFGLTDDVELLCKVISISLYACHQVNFIIA